MRGRGARLNLVLTIAVVVVVVAVFAFRGRSSPSATGAATSPQSVAQAFAGAYMRYLDGQIPLAQLPDADAGVLQTANGIVIPPRLRAGQLTLVQLDVRQSSGSAATVVFTARDGRKPLPTTIALARRGGGWEVVGLVPPDMSLLLAPPKIPPAPSAAQTAARSFVLAYADYREGVRHTSPVGLPPIAKEIASDQDPLAHIAATHTAANLESLNLGPVTNGMVSATAQLSDGGSSATVLFTLQKGAGPWMASQFILGG